jgi:hypothetical protein
MEIFYKDIFQMDNLIMQEFNTIMKIFIKVKCIKINSMDKEFLKVNQLPKKAFLDMAILFMELLTIKIALSIKDHFKII